jgi:hypothetical protein
VYFYPGSSDINCSVSAFSDALHPSAASHALLGQLALSTVPEPGSIALVLLGIVMLVGFRRRTRIRPSFAAL